MKSILDRLIALFRRVDTSDDDDDDACGCFSKGHSGVLYLPPSPRELIADRLKLEAPLLNRKVNRKKDQPLTALYRMYEHFVLDQHIELRNEFEAFWLRSEWPIDQIPDPKDADPERYAVLACLPKLLVLAFNKRIEVGLPRNAPATLTSNQLEKWRRKKKVYEEVPPWLDTAPYLRRKYRLWIPHWDNDRHEFVTLAPAQYHKVSRECLEQGVVVCRPDIQFV